MNSWPSFDPFMTNTFSSFQQIQPICYPMDFSYSVFPSTFYSAMEYPAFFSQEVQKQNLVTCLTQPDSKVLQKKEKTMQVKENKNLKGVKNVKTNVFKDFLKTIKKDASSVLLVKQALKSDYPVKKFIDQLYQKLPKQGKYISFKTIIDLCKNQVDAEFSKIFRTLFQNFLTHDYQLSALTKKKSKLEYLKACREMRDRINLTSNVEER